MRGSRLLVGLLLAAPIHITAQSTGQKDPAEYNLIPSEYNTIIESLDKELSSKRRTVGDVLDSALYLTGRPSDEMYDTNWFVKGFTWNPLQTEDVKGENWHPEGITTSFDAGYSNDIIPGGENNAAGNTGVIIVSWNDIRNLTGRARNPSEGVRVSFIRKGTAELGISGQAYSHALLVEPFVNDDGKPDFRPLRDVESGGVVWRKNWLYISDKRMGLRVFDLDHIYQVGTSDAIGRNSKGGYSGGSHPYVIPQALTYRTFLGKDLELEPNSLSLDRNHSSPSLLISESISSKADNQTIARFSFNDTTGLLETNSLNAVPANWVYRTNVRDCEGIVFAERSYFMVSNEGTDVKSDILNWKAGSFAEEYKRMLPNNAQSIAYVPEQRELWIVGGLQGKRYVMALSATMKNQTIVRPTDDPASSQSAIPQDKLDEALGGEEDGGSKKMSSGAIAGVVLGVLVGVAMILGAILFFLRRKHQQRRDRERAGAIDASHQRGSRFYKAELDPQSTGGTGWTGNSGGRHGSIGMHEAAAIVPAEKAADVPVEKAAPVPVELESPGWDGRATYSPTATSPPIDAVVSPMSDQGDWRNEKARNQWV